MGNYILSFLKSADDHIFTNEKIILVQYKNKSATFYIFNQNHLCSSQVLWGYKF